MVAFLLFGEKMNRSYDIVRYSPRINVVGLDIYSLVVKPINKDVESVEYKITDAGPVIQFSSEGYFESKDSCATVWQSDLFQVHWSTKISKAFGITFQDLVCCHMTNNWNCSMRDLEIYYNLYLSYKGLITKSELFEIVDEILGE